MSLLGKAITQAQQEREGTITMPEAVPPNKDARPLPADYSTLSRATMRTVKIAFDVDGTLRCNCTDTCRDRNTSIVDLFRILNTFKNVELYVWSGGGAEYAWHFANLFQLPVSRSHCISKFGAPEMDIVVDDIQETNLGKLNLIVREK